MNDNVAQSINPRINNPDHFFSGLKPNCFQEFDKDKLLSIKEFRSTAGMFALNKISKPTVKKKQNHDILRPE